MSASPSSLSRSYGCLRYTRRGESVEVPVWRVAIRAFRPRRRWVRSSSPPMRSFEPILGGPVCPLQRPKDEAGGLSSAQLIVRTKQALATS